MARRSKKTVTGRRERQEKKRIRAGEMFEAGKTRAEVAEELAVTWRSAHNWYQQWKQGGLKALLANGRPGPAYKINDEQLKHLEQILLEGPISYGYQNDLWTLRRVAEVVGKEFSEKLSSSETWRLLQRMGWSSQKPVRKARERDEDAMQNGRTSNGLRFATKLSSKDARLYLWMRAV